MHRRLELEKIENPKLQNHTYRLPAIRPSRQEERWWGVELKQLLYRLSFLLIIYHFTEYILNSLFLSQIWTNSLNKKLTNLLNIQIKF